jgi:hypothetical protein
MTNASTHTARPNSRRLPNITLEQHLNAVAYHKQAEDECRATGVVCLIAHHQTMQDHHSAMARRIAQREART